MLSSLPHCVTLMADLCPVSSSVTGEGQRKEEEGEWEDMNRREDGDREITGQLFALCVG